MLKRRLRKLNNNIYFKYFKKLVIAAIFFVLLYLILIYKIYFLFNSQWNFLLYLYTTLTSVFLMSRFIISYFYTDEHKVTYLGKEFPSVSFVISCKNEEDSIARTIDTCLVSEYPGKIECIAVDDGSTDKTLNEMIKTKRVWGKQLSIIAFPENKGKREGMAEGVLAAKGEIIIFVDSDSFVKRNAVRLIVEHFLEDPKVGAVSGNSQVENEDINVLTKMQSARYGVSYEVFKTSESVFGTVTCCPGCFSAYRKNAIMEVLPKWRFQKFLGTRSTFGDDRSLTNFVMRTWKVRYCRSAMASTIVPEQYRKFFKQQLRWKKSWIREGTNAGSFIWKKNPIASMSFYINLIIPIFGPLVVLKILLFDTTLNGKNPLFYVMGLVAMSLLFGIYYYFIQPNKYWWYVIFFTILNAFVLIWQMPIALLKIRDTRWGTR
jgi:hyaluronan synthase